MTEHLQPAGGEFHDGELTVQRRAGVQAEAARLSPMLGRAELRGGTAAFLADATLAALTARDHSGRLWISPLTGRPGFLTAVSPNTLLIESTVPEGDPLHRLRGDQAMGLVVMDFAARRRVRINGRLGKASERALEVIVQQAYGNCPQYIQQRHLSAGPRTSADASTSAARPGIESRGRSAGSGLRHLLPRDDTSGARQRRIPPRRSDRIRASGG